MSEKKSQGAPDPDDLPTEEELDSLPSMEDLLGAIAQEQIAEYRRRKAAAEAAAKQAPPQAPPATGVQSRSSDCGSCYDLGDTRWKKSMRR
jgi:hypothetical protein